MTPFYQHFTLRDFVLDDAFRQWVFQPNEQNKLFWRTFQLQHSEQQTVIDEAVSLLLHLNAPYDELTDNSQQRIWQTLEQRFDERQTPEDNTRSRLTWQHLTVWRQRRIWQAAASLAGLLLVVGSVLYEQSLPKQKRIHATFGENQSVTLPDGSTVLLNGNSTLTYTDQWATDNAREVWLDGEGFFKVTKQENKGRRVKFVTHTSGLDITVLGTQFNVNTRRGTTAVTLLEGRVQLRQPNKPSSRVIAMRPGQVASVRPTLETVDLREEKPQVHTAWVNHQFMFDNTPLGDIAQQLRDTFGLDVVFDDSILANRRFTGNLSNQSIETLLTTLSLTFDLTVQRTGNRISLRLNH